MADYKSDVKITEESPTGFGSVEDLTLSQMTKVFGDSGTERFSGYFLEEPNADWREESRIDNVEAMRRTDAACKAALNALKSPILATSWFVRSKEEDDEIRDFVEDCLFNMKYRTWKEFLREALAYFDFGYYVFEKIYERQDGKVKLIDLAPRIPHSIEKWITQDGNAGITQQIYYSQNDRPFGYVSIPAKKLLIFTNEKEGDDVTGQSVLRAAWRHYYNKDVLSKTRGIAAERYGVGVPVITLPENYGESDKSDAQNMARNLRSNQTSHMVLPNGYDVKILTPEGNPLGDMIEKAIAHENRMIMTTVMAQFLDLGSGNTGSFALNEGQTNFFLQAVEDKARYVAEQIQRQVIIPLVKLNFGEQEYYPELQFAPLGEADMDMMSQTIERLLSSGAIKKRAEDEAYFRDYFKFPEMSEEEVEEEQGNPEDIPQPEDDEVEPDNLDQKKKHICQCIQHLTEQPYKPWRPLTMQEQRADMEMLNEEYNTIEGQIIDEFTAVTDTEINRMLDFARKVLSAGAVAEIVNLTFKNKNKLKSALDRAIKQSIEVGKKGAAREMNVEPPTTPKPLRQGVGLESITITDTYQQTMENEAKSFIKTAIITSIAVPAAIKGLQQRLRDTSARLTTNIQGSVVGQNLNRGRQVVFDNYVTQLVSLQRSEVLDSRTCNMCLSLDGRVIAPDDPLANLALVHTNCFVEGTKVKTKEGEKNIEDIKIGDVVATHKDNWFPVYHTMQSHYKGEIIEIELEDGRTIQCTPNHRFWVDGDWKTAQELTTSDELEASNLN